MNTETRIDRFVHGGIKQMPSDAQIKLSDKTVVRHQLAPYAKAQ